MQKNMKNSEYHFYENDSFSVKNNLEFVGTETGSGRNRQQTET